MQHPLIVIAHNIRSTHNVGSLFRTAEGIGGIKLLLTGYTPYPTLDKDARLPHIRNKIDAQIQKTALDAQHSLAWEQYDDIQVALDTLRAQDYVIMGLEQDASSQLLPSFTPPAKLAILLGSEVTGIDHELRTNLDGFIEIPMKGKKESFNVVEAATMAMYHCMLY